ncbi:MAG: transcription antitermination protein NusB, partial [Clostridia bacterium]|nr:transcription antitermination protein NusB [Clostridia bacterium]
IAEQVTHFAEYRIYPADKALMLIALTEIKYFDDIPNVVSVNEATALARTYSTENSADFVNGVLGGFINE